MAQGKDFPVDWSQFEIIEPASAVDWSQFEVIDKPASSLGDQIGDAASEFLPGIWSGVNRLAGGIGLIAGMPAAVATDALMGSGTEQQDAWASQMVDPPLREAARVAPSADASFGAQAGSAVGGFVPDMAAMLLTGGASPIAQMGLRGTAAAAGTAGVGTVRGVVGQAALDAARTSALPSVAHGAQTAIDVLNAGGNSAQALGAFGSEAGANAFTNILPLNVASKAGAVSGQVVSNALQGAGTNVVADVLASTMVNPFLPDQIKRDPYDPTQLGISALIGAPMGVAFGDRPRGPVSHPVVGDRQPNVDGAAPTADDSQVEGVTLDQFRAAIAEYAAQLDAKRNGTPDETIDEGGQPFVVKGTPPAELTADEIEQLQRIEQFKDDPAGVAASFGFRIVDLPESGAEVDPVAQEAVQDAAPDAASPEVLGPLASMLALPPPEPIQVDPAGVATTPAQRDQRQQLGIAPDIARIIASQKARENAPGAAPAPATTGVPTNEGQVSTGQDAAQQNAAVQGQVDAGQEGQAGLLTAKVPQETAAPEPVQATPEQETARQDLGMFKAATRSRGVVSIPVSAAQRAALEADKFYVPMRGRADPANDVGGRRPATILRRSNDPNIERALGRGEGNLPKNILPEMISDAQQAIFDAELVHVKRALLRQAMAYPNPAVWDVEPVRTEYRFDKATGEAVLTVTTAAVDADSTLVIPMPNGKTYRLRFADPDLQRALMTMGEQDMKAFVRVFGAINRWQSAVFTRYNPAFVPVNLVRDVGFGLTSVAANHGAKVLGDTMASYAPAVRALWVDARDAAGDADKPVAEMTMVDFAREFAASGGKMNAVAYADMDTIAKDFAARVRTLNDLWADGARGLMMREAGRRTAEKAFGLIERSNDAIENALRLALYASLRKNGKSIDQAAEAAKNVTVNFRRKGSLGAVMNAIYLFFNAGMQGAHATLKLLRNKKVIAGLTTMGAMQGLFAWLLMNEDDDGDGVSAWDAIPAYRRERSFIIPTGLLFGGDPKHVTMIPLQYGFNLFPYLGGRIAQRAHDEIHGTLRPKDSLIGDMAKATINSFIPVPIYEGPEALLGNLAQIVMQLKANKDDLGRPITSENPFAAGDPPRSTMGRDTTSAIFKGFATALNRIGGGDDYTPPWFLPQLTNVSPEELDFIWSQVAGGVGSTASRGMSAVEGLATGRFDSAGEVMAATPIINAFGGTFRDERAVADRYYAIGDEIARAETKRAGLLESGDDAGADAVGETAYGQARHRWKNAQKIVKRLSKQIREARIDPNLSATEREAEIKRLTRERAEKQREFLQAVQEMEREAA